MSSERLYATGRRKTSSARIYLSQGSGAITVNNKDLSDYFGREVAQMLVKQPLELCNLIDKVDINAKVKYEDECLGFSFNWSRQYTHMPENPTSNSFQFLFSLKEIMENDI